MRITVAIIISLLTVIIGLALAKPYTLVPVSFLIASIIEILTRRWVASRRLGSWTNLSFTLKLIFMLIGFYALIGQIVCVVFIIWWFNLRIKWLFYILFIFGFLSSMAWYVATDKKQKRIYLMIAATIWLIILIFANTIL